ncbi:16S rRNA (guanine(966)-N(2))-methyltransferase RsmD [Lutibacter agarilyticus]|uniref:16S rRNA (Guanine(966)-N(2))-methyltransferase RsmD n=1 Tax=Lutibacter agarilyticus TaxID=1109740 RepID=A0A238WW55_9FLAO|nr:16S rRNA (guanine(966)-N(2))-methyltransferase RsmD [Lutibacter agarilyticus]SNR50747.1 16S rRNA (guanine(966)-N(2))-methyltransferase RsmD [Lutibacter agarilyticus]
MRIISGKHKSKRLLAPKNLPVRPTTDMAKEALFNIINNLYYFHELNVLDLFSGTGNISYEFGSRGTENITAIDAHFGCIKYINTTSKELDLNIQAYKSDVYKFLEKCNTKFDVIFADPPYDFDVAKFEKIVALVFEKNLLNEGGVLIIEHSKHTNFIDNSQLSYQKKYGGNMFSFFENETSELE